jgi:ABC-type sugar transport system ATPase subunit
MIAGFESITSGDMLIRGNRINNVPPERQCVASAPRPKQTLERTVMCGNSA